MSLYSELIIAHGADLVAYYKLNESAGTDCADASGNALDGAYAGGFALAQALGLATSSDTATAFDGTDGRVTFGSGAGLWGAPLNGAGVVSLEAWIINHDAPSAEQRIINLIVDGTSVGANIKISTANTLAVTGRSVIGDTLQEATAAFTTDNVLRHVFGILDFANDKIYVGIDGEITNPAGTSVAFGNATYTDGTSSANDTVGGIGGAYFDGVIGHAAIYKSALTPAVWREHYHLGKYGRLAAAAKSRAVNGYYSVRHLRL